MLRRFFYCEQALFPLPFVFFLFFCDIRGRVLRALLCSEAVYVPVYFSILYFQFFSRFFFPNDRQSLCFLRPLVPFIGVNYLCICLVFFFPFPFNTIRKLPFLPLLLVHPYTQDSLFNTGFPADICFLLLSPLDSFWTPSSSFAHGMLSFFCVSPLTCTQLPYRVSQKERP